MQLLKITEYESGAGNIWYTTSTAQLGWKWRYIPNMLGLNARDYVKELQKYGAINIKYYAPTDCLLYSFPTKELAHKWVLYINRVARNKSYYWGEPDDK